MTPLIRTEHLRVVYNQGEENEYTALTDINIEIFKEEYIIFFGPSGCGKSTLLYTILGLQPQTEGKIFIDEQDSSGFSEKQKIIISSQFYGIVFQNFNLVYSLNVVDNVALPQLFMGKGGRERKEKSLKLLQRLGIETKAALLPSTLSGGQQQRVAICRALINNPQVVLADEPVGNLDSESAMVVMNILKEINEKDKKTVILVTHDPSYLRFADRIYYFKDGKIDRVVRNPARNKETLHKVEYEHLSRLERYARVFPTLNVEQLKAWSLTNYLFEECTSSQIIRIEAAMERLLTGQLSERQFFEALHRPFSEGGAGLYRSTALSYSLRISRLLRVMHSYKQTLSDHSSPERHRKMIALLKEFVLEEYRSVLSAEQNRRLVLAIEKRILEKISTEDFVQSLNLSVQRGGVGLRISTAERLADRLELVLAQHTH